MNVENNGEHLTPAPKPPSAFRASQGSPDIAAIKTPEVEVGSLGIPTVSGSRDFEDFVYILSHDIRASVRALAEIPDWIREDLVDEGIPVTGALSDNLGLLERHARRLDQMLIDLLTYSRVGRKQAMRSAYLETALNTVLMAQDIPDGFKVTSDLGRKTIKMGDVDVETFLSALISNAIKHHDKDHGVVEISTHTEDGYCIVKISDDGPGIPEKSRARMLEAMTTLKSRDEVEGSGMGLAIVRKIVDLYGGFFEWAEPSGERGTAIKIGLPL